MACDIKKIKKVYERECLGLSHISYLPGTKKSYDYSV